MAKIVIAGSADCPYFAKIELLADKLAKNLPEFNLHKIVKQPKDWEKWLNNTCNERGWRHKKSPMVWRELVDRGGKGLLIGGANEFQEYANGYYSIKSDFCSDDMTRIGGENLTTKQAIDDEEREFKEAVKPVHVCITNASNPVSYSMVEGLAKGEALGSDTQMSIRLLDTAENQETLQGLKMEVFDLACPLVRDLEVTSDPTEAFTDCSVIIVLDEVAKAEEESKADWLKRNHEYFVNYAQLINEKACHDVKVIVAGAGPVNFNVFMMQEQMPNIPRQNVVAMSRMVENHAKALIAERLKVNSASVVDVVVWGHSSDKYYLDLTKARVHNYDGAIWGPPSYSLPVQEMIHDEKWLSSDFLKDLEIRQTSVKTALGHRPSASQAAAALSLLNHWWNGSPQGQMFSLAVQSEGWYDVPEGLIFSFPVTFNPAGYWTVVQDIELSDENKEKIQETIKDLLSEKEVIYPPPYVPPPTPSPEPVPTPTDAQNTNNSNQTSDVAGEGEEGLGRIAEDREGEEQAATELNRPKSGGSRPGSGGIRPASGKRSASGSVEDESEEKQADTS